MKILEQYAGALTNFEVLDILRSRGARRDLTRVIASVSPSEFKAFDYLKQSAAKNQTREIIHKFADKCKKFGLTQAEILNVVNLRPSSDVGVYTIIEEFDAREMDGKIDDLVKIIANQRDAMNARILKELKEDLQALELANINIKYKLKLLDHLQGNPSDVDEWRYMGNEERIDRVKMYTECNIP